MRLGGILRAAVTILSTGCAGIGDIFKEPDFRLDEVIVRGVGMSGGTLDFIVDVYNPNNFDLHGTSLRVGFDVEDSHLGDIEYDDDFSVDRGDTTRLRLPLQFSWAGVGGAVRSALGYGEVPYKMKGEVSIQTPFGRRAVPFSKEGRAPLTRGGGGIPIPGTH